MWAGGSTPVLGADASSYSFTLGPSDPADAVSVGHAFSVGAIQGNSSYDCLSYSFTATIDAGACDSTITDYGGNTLSGPLAPPTTAATSNSASDIGMVFQAPSDENGSPIMTDNNPDSPTPGASEGSSGDPTPPAAQLTEVDFIYPDDAPLGTQYTLTIDPSVLRFYDDANGDNEVLGVPIRGMTFGCDGPTTLYAELSQGLTGFAGGGAAVKFSCDGASSTATPVGVSLSMDGLAPEDPDASLPIDPAGDTTPADAAVNLHLPATLANGTTVTLTLDSSVVPDVTIYDGDPTASPANPILGAGANGATTVSWTIGSEIPLSTVYADASTAVAADPNFLTLAVTPPTAPASAMMMAAQATSQPATTQATQPAGTVNVITVHYWKSHLISGFPFISVGHVSITLGDNTYISWWPQHQRPTAPAVVDPNYAFEAGQEEIPVRDYLFFGLNQAAMENWWNNFKAHNKLWKYPYGPDCATVVEDALRAGGLPIAQNWDYTTPDLIVQLFNKFGTNPRYAWWLVQH